MEQARPQTSGEEELQLQLALAMSREAAEQVHHVIQCHPKTAALFDTSTANCMIYYDA